MTRTQPPKRRPSLTVPVEWQGHAFTITVGRDAITGRLLDVFADTLKGGQMQATLADTCVVISIAMQSGVPLRDMAKSLALVPVLHGPEGATAPASVVGAVLGAMIEIEGEGA